MPKKSDRRVVLKIYQLRQQSLTLNQIVEQLENQFDESMVPDTSTVSRQIKRFEVVPPKELAEDIPFSWGTMTEVPWEYSRVVLDMWALYEASDRFYKSQGMEMVYGPFTQRLAKWSWRVLRAFGMDSPKGIGHLFENPSDQFAIVAIETPTEYDIQFIAMEYCWREIASVVLHETLHTEDLDMFLALTPWKGKDWLLRYIEIRYGEASNHPGQPEPIRWHFGDIAWLEKVSPIAAMYQEQNLRRAFPQGRQRSPRSPGDEKFYRALNRLIEGLLGSQIGQYSDARFNIPSQENPSSDVLQEPWYFEHLDDVGDMFNKKEKTLPHGGTAVPALPRLVWDD